MNRHRGLVYASNVGRTQACTWSRMIVRELWCCDPRRSRGQPEGHIHQQPTEATHTKPATFCDHLSMRAAYDRKKYTWKLLYSHMMGFEVDFGHKQASDLIPSSKFDEKQVGYQALTILLNEVRSTHGAAFTALRPQF
jgi:hypothetical protein